MSKVTQMAEQLDELSISDLADLVPMLEERWGVKAKPDMPEGFMIPGQVPDAQPAKQTEFDIELTSYGDKKINVIKVIRELTGLGIKEAKELAERAPVVVKEAVSAVDADEIKSKLEAAGATVTVK